MKVRTWTLLGTSAIALVAVMVPINQRYLHLGAGSLSGGTRVPAHESRDMHLEDSKVNEAFRTPQSASNLLCSNFYQMICLKRGETRDPSGFVRRDLVGEVEVLRMLEETISSHPEWSREQVYDELTRLVYGPSKVKRVRGAFSWVQQALIRFIEGQPESLLTKAEKIQLQTRVSAVELNLPPPSDAYSDDPDLITKSGVYYETLSDGKARMRVGGAYLSSVTSWFNIIYTIAHELGHAIDPCELRAAGITLPAYQRLSRCFLKTGLVAMRESRMECGNDDQLSETFADWMAVQIASEALKKFATEFDPHQLRQAAVNSVRDLCEQEEALNELDLTYHPSPEVRIEKIFGRHPEIRETLGCKNVRPSMKLPHENSGEYCRFE